MCHSGSGFPYGAWSEEADRFATLVHTGGPAGSGLANACCPIKARFTESTLPPILLRSMTCWVPDSGTPNVIEAWVQMQLTKFPISPLQSVRFVHLIRGAVVRVHGLVQCKRLLPVFFLLVRRKSSASVYNLRFEFVTILFGGTS
jgi:hypothetical protein